MKLSIDPALRPIEPPIEDDPCEPYLDASDIPQILWKLVSQLAMMTAENDTHSLLDSLEDPDNSNQQMDDNQITLAMDNQSIFAAEKKKLSKNVKGKASLNGLARRSIDLGTGGEYFGQTSYQAF